MMFAQLENCVKVPTETILFNIDSKSPLTKDKTAILRCFCKSIYDTGLLPGNDLKVANWSSSSQSQVKRSSSENALSVSTVVLGKKAVIPLLSLRTIL